MRRDWRTGPPEPLFEADIEVPEFAEPEAARAAAAAPTVPPFLNVSYIRFHKKSLYMCT